MALGIGGGKGFRNPNIRSPHIGRLAQAMAARGQGSLSAAAANGVTLLSATKPQPATGNEPKQGIGTGLPVTKPPKPAAAPANPGGKTQTKGGFHPYQVLENYEPGKPLSGKEMREYARALAVTETKPTIHGYAGLVRESEKAKALEAKGLGKLGERTSGNVSSVYHGIATSEAENIARQQALGSQLTANSANIASAAGSELAAQQTGALGDYEAQLAQRGAPSGGGAQEALAQAVAAQTQTQSADSQAAQQFAGTQAASNAALAGGLAGSALMQGGQAVGAINRDTVNRVGESNQKYDQSINGLREKLGEAKASFGTDFAKNLLSLRGNEQKFILGKAATQSEKAKLAQAKVEAKTAQEESKAERAEKQAERAEGKTQQEIENQRAQTKTELEAKKYGLENWKAHHPGAGENKTAEKAKEIKQEVQEVKSLLHNAVKSEGKPPKSEQELAALTNYLNGKASAEPALVAKVLKNWWLENRTHGPGATHR